MILIAKPDAFFRCILLRLRKWIENELTSRRSKEPRTVYYREKDATIFCVWQRYRSCGRSRACTILLSPPGDVCQRVRRRASGADVSSPTLKKETEICVWKGEDTSRRVAVFNYFYHGSDVCKQKIKFSPTKHMAALSVIKVDRPRGDRLFKVITFPIKGERDACSFNKRKGKH